MSGATLPFSRDECYSPPSLLDRPQGGLAGLPATLARISPNLARLSPLPRTSIEVNATPTAEGAHLELQPVRNKSKFNSLDLHPPHNIREQVGRHDRALHARRNRWLDEGGHYISAVCIGVLLGALGVAFHLGYAALANLRLSVYFKFAEAGHFHMAFLVNTSICLLYLVIPCAAVLVFPTVAGSGIPGILAFLNGIDVPTLLTPVVFLGKFVGSIFAVGSGLALGPEGPAIHTGAAFGSMFCHFWYKVVMRSKSNGAGNDAGHFETNRQHFTAMGAGAGVAALFRAPLAGTVFVIEEAANHVNIRDIWATFMACVAAFATVYVIESYSGDDHGGTFIFNVALDGGCGNFESVEYFFFAVLGVFCGFFGAFFNCIQNRLNSFRAKYMNKSHLIRVLELVVIAALSSAVTVFFPMLFPCKDATAQALMTETSGCLEPPMKAAIVTRSIYESGHHGEAEVAYTLAPGFFGVQWSEECIWAIDYDTCRSGGAVPLQNCTIAQVPYTESACYLPGIEDFTSNPLSYCCGFDELHYLHDWVDSNGTNGTIYGHNNITNFDVIEPHLHLEVDEASRDGQHYCPGDTAQSPMYSPAALLSATPLGSDVANVLFTQGMPTLLPAGVMAAYFCIYFALAVVTAGAATPGGLIVPFIILGGLMGRLSALLFTSVLEGLSSPSSNPSWLYHAWEPLMAYMDSTWYTNLHHIGFQVVPTLPDPGAYAIAGAAAFMAATGRLSLFFTVLMLEATGYLAYLLPISIGVIVATLTGNLFNSGLYHILMHVAKMPYLPTVASITQEAIKVKDLHEGQKCHVVGPLDSFHTWKALLKAAEHNGFPVVDIHGHLVGVVLRRVLSKHVKKCDPPEGQNKMEAALAWHNVYNAVTREMDSAPVVVHDRDPVDQALKIFSRMRLRHLVVVCRDKPVYLLTRHDLHPHVVSHGMIFHKASGSLKVREESTSDGSSDGSAGECSTNTKRNTIHRNSTGNMHDLGTVAEEGDMHPDEIVLDFDGENPFDEEEGEAAVAVHESQRINRADSLSSEAGAWSNFQHMLKRRGSLNFVT